MEKSQKILDVKSPVVYTREMGSSISLSLPRAQYQEDEPGHQLVCATAPRRGAILYHPWTNSSRMEFTSLNQASTCQSVKKNP